MFVVFEDGDSDAVKGVQFDDVSEVFGVGMEGQGVFEVAELGIGGYVFEGGEEGGFDGDLLAFLGVLGAAVAAAGHGCVGIGAVIGRWEGAMSATVGEKVSTEMRGTEMRLVDNSGCTNGRGWREVLRDWKQEA